MAPGLSLVPSTDAEGKPRGLVWFWCQDGKGREGRGHPVVSCFLHLKQRALLPLPSEHGHPLAETHVLVTSPPTGT